MRAQRKWAANDGKYFLEISPSAWRFLEFECSKANNRETGGILIGYYSNDHSTAIITEASSPPPDSTYGYNWFWRGIAGLRLLLFQHWRDTRCKTYYIGEWHYHPSVQIIPSSEDFNQMQAIRDLSNYKCREPILLIVGKKNKGAMQLRAFVFPSGKQLYEFVCLS